MAALKRLLTGAADRYSARTDLALAILRIFTGLAMALGHGLGKVPVSDGFVAGVAKLGFPMPVVFAWAAALSELVGGLLLALGLFTRPAALFVFITMAVAAFLRHADDPFATKEKALMYAAIALVYLLIGAGRYSVDARLRRR